MNQDAIDAIELALNKLGCSQKDLALQLNVSPTQISKWKKGEYMSSEMEDRIKELTKIGDHHPAVVLWAGSVNNAEKWENLFRELAEMADESGETGYDTYPLKDEMDLLSWSTIRVLSEMGVAPPKTFPKELDLKESDEEESDEEESDEKWNLIDENPYSSLVYKIYKSLTGTRLEVRAPKRYVRQNSILSNIGKCHGKGTSKQIPNAPRQAGGRHGQR